MIINKIKLKNFRNISDEVEYNFNDNFTVIIGINGKGKSTILHSLRIACGAFFLSIPEVKKRHITPDEIHLAYKEKQLVQVKPVKVEAYGSFEEGQSICWKRQILEDSNTTTSSEKEVGNIRKIGKDKYEKIVKEGNDKTPLPIMAFFGTSRAHGAGRNRTSRIGRQIFKEGYQDWYEMKSSTFKYEDWLSSYEILRKNEKEYPNTMDAFVEAIKKANPYIVELEVVSGQLWVKVDIGGDVSDLLPIEFHSDGIRFFTEMAAEIAYRCIILNGYLDREAVKQSAGIVMIDEVDLHLHPSWQRHVIKDLKLAFPKIQFVSTTHSPFIVQSLSAKELINLDKITDIDLKSLSISEVVEDVMGVPSEMSEDNIIEEDYSSEYLKTLEVLDDQNKRQVKHKLDQIELQISDPAVRAFLKMKRLEKDI
ncbi:MAG: AAA family ATPase [Sporocytophaga sp.]|nr:AAA family ATPase [Sporocytophaga sp.]